MKYFIIDDNFDINNFENKEQIQKILSKLEGYSIDEKELEDLELGNENKINPYLKRVYRDQDMDLFYGEVSIGALGFKINGETFQIIKLLSGDCELEVDGTEIILNQGQIIYLENSMEDLYSSFGQGKIVLASLPMERPEDKILKML